MILLVPMVLTLQAPGPGPLTLAQALARARAHRPVVAEAAALVAEARGLTRTAGTIPNPIASYSWTGAEPRQHAIATQPLDWLLRRSADRAAGRAGESRAAADSTSVLADLGRQVRITFYDALAGAEALRLTTDGAALADSLSRAADARYAAGDISRLERDQVAQEAQRARYAVSLAREESRVAAAAFARAVGESDPAAASPAGSLDDGLALELPARPPLDRLPAVRAAVADSLASAARARSAAIARLPLPEVQGGVEWNAPSTVGEGSTILLGISIPLPLWNQGGGAAAAARARADRDAAAATEARSGANLALSGGRIRLEEAAGRARFDRDSLYPAARRLREQAVAAYRAGETSVLPVFDAMRGERDAALTLVRDLVAFQDALADWNALVGLME